MSFEVKFVANNVLNSGSCNVCLGDFNLKLLIRESYNMVFILKRERNI